jgi:hypothetical protein
LFHADREIVNRTIAPFFQMAKTGKSAFFPEILGVAWWTIALEIQKFCPGRPDFGPLRRLSGKPLGERPVSAGRLVHASRRAAR